MSIIREAEREGQLETIRQYNHSPSLLDRWRNKYLNGGVDELKNAHKRIDPHLRVLEEENERLKRIIAKQSLEIEVKDELLKERPIHPKTIIECGPGNSLFPGNFFDRFAQIELFQNVRDLCGCEFALLHFCTGEIKLFESTFNLY